MALHIITLTNKSPHPNVKHLQESISISNDYFHIIQDYDCNLKNLSKIYKTFDYIQNCTSIDDNDIICIVDGHDVLFNKKMYTPDDILTKFKNVKADIIFTTENKCSHHTPAAKLFFEMLFQKRYLNSGVILAYKKSYLILFRDIIDKISILNSPWMFSDQRIIGQYLANCYIDSLPVAVYLDIDDIFSITVNTSTCLQFNSLFVHVTFLAMTSQLQKYNTFLEFIN